MSNIGVTPSGFPVENFVSQSFVTTGQTLQQAIDAAPSSLVTEISTGIVSYGGGVYGVPATSKPSAFFIDAMFAEENPGAFTGTTLNPSDGLYDSNAYLWTFDSANSRIICYNKGAPVSVVTCANYHAVIAANATTYDSIILRPGIVVVGLGAGSSQIKAISGRTTTIVTSVTEQYAFTVVAASYSGIVGFDIIRNNASFSGVGGFFGLGFSTEISADNFIAKDCHIYMDANVNPTGTYNLALFFASRAARGTRSKNVSFINCNIESYSRQDILETYTKQYNGLVFFENCVLNGGIYVDGATNTFVLINSKQTNFNSHNPGRVQQKSPAQSFGLNFGSDAPFDGYDYDYIAINSPHYVQRPDDITVTSVYAASSLNLIKKLFINSPVFSKDRLLQVKAGISPVSAPYAATFESRNSPMPPMEITTTGSSAMGYSLTVITPLLPKSFTQQTYATQGATAKQFGILNILYKDLAERGTARILVRGRFAANTNTKALKARSGVGSTLSAITLADISGASWAGAFNGTAFEYRAQVTLSGTTVLISGQMTSAAISSPLRYIAEQTIADGQYLQLVLDATGVATGDITVIYQSIEVDG